MKIESFICLGIAFAIVNTRPATAQPPIAPVANASAIAVEDDPRCAATGDFNGDGKMDFATANQGTNDVSVLLASGANGFTKAKKSPVKVGAAPRSLVVGDFNGDKKPDLAVGNSGANNVSILLGDGSGQFSAAPGAPIKTGVRPLALTVSDFDGNGNADLVVANNVAGSVTVLLGNGVGGFAEAAGSPLPVGRAPFFVTTGDLNADGEIDLVVANSGTNDVSVLMGQGGGSFGAKTDFATGASPRSIAIADFNGDNKADLITANTTGNSVSFLPGNGNGRFGARTDFAVGVNPRSVVACEFNHNGKLDLAVVSFTDNKVYLLSGDGAGSFAMVATPIAVGSEPIWAVLADMNGDAKPDLVVVNSDSNDVTLLAANATTGFKPLVSGL